MRQEILRQRVLKNAIEVPHTGNVSGGECFLHLLLEISLNVEPLPTLSEGFDVRPNQIPQLHYYQPYRDDWQRTGLRGNNIRRVYRDKGILGV